LLWESDFAEGIWLMPIPMADTRQTLRNERNSFVSAAVLVRLEWQIGMDLK